MIALKANQAQTFGEIRSRSVARPAAGAHGRATLSDKGKKPSHLIDYARRWFAEERWPMSPKLRAVRAIMEKLEYGRDAKPSAPARHACQSAQKGGRPKPPPIRYARITGMGRS
jgi:hypothetical protein